MSKQRGVATAKKAAARPPVSAAMVIGVEEDPGRVRVRAGSEEAIARVAVASPYAPAEGDRVVVAGEGEALFVIGVLHAARAPELGLPDGGSVVVRDGGAEIRDARGRLVVRYADGAAEIAAPSGDLKLSAPAGRVVVEAGVDVEIRGARDVKQQAARSVSLAAGAEGKRAELKVDLRAIEASAPRLSAKANESELVTGEGSVTARRIVTRAAVLAQQVERLEVTAVRIVEKARDVFRDAADLAQTRVGRARTVVREAFNLRARRTVVASKEDTSIDGRRVLLG